MELEKVAIKRIIGPTPSGAAILLGNEKKTFVVFVGFYEATALLREINHEKPPRPMTHDLLQSIFIGFDIRLKQLIVSSIVDNTFCATLILEQKVTDRDGEWVGKRNEVRIDARPSDCLVLAMKNGVEIFVTREVFEQVQDVSHMTDLEAPDGEEKGESVEIPDFLGEEFDIEEEETEEEIDEEAEGGDGEAEEDPDEEEGESEGEDEDRV
ncbi:MAG: bifunctional nuclease family protein [Planctomycetes bacterium]|nr:bifunctional nuclease family protein [Planctomycetota bacterium]